MAILGKRSHAGRLLLASVLGVIALGAVAHAELRITEVMPNGTGANEADEWIELVNTGPDAVDLSSFRIGDEETPGGGEGFYAFPAVSLAAGELAIATRNATSFALAFSVPASTKVFAAAAAANGFALTKDTVLGTGELGLGNGSATTGDEVLLLQKIGDGHYELVDGMSYGGGNAVTTYAPPGGTTVVFISTRVLGAPVELGSYARISANVDTDDASDWQVQASSSPGTAPINVCGDSKLQAGETCDDGNGEADDGCDAQCLVECGFTCLGTGGGSCGEDCGDGDVAGLEECDDGDALSGDGCDASCHVEPGWACDEPEPLCDTLATTKSSCTLDPCLLPLRITEVHADGLVDPDSEWIELTNEGDLAIDLARWSFGDQATAGAAGEGAIRFDDGRSISPHETIVLAQNGSRFQSDFADAPDYEYGTDSASTAPYLHRVSDFAPNTNIQLDNASDQVVLACAGVVRDALRWGPNEVPAPTADYSPASPASGPVTFERFAGADSGTAADWSISRCPSPGVAVNPNGAPVPAASLVTVASGIATTFSLAAEDPEGDPLTFALDTTGLVGTVADLGGGNVRYTPAGTGTTRFTFSASDACSTSVPALVELVVGPAVCDAKLANVRITEVHSDARVDNDGEWIELTNSGPSAVDLGFLRVGDEESEGGSEGMVLFRPGTILAAGEATVIAFSAASFKDDWDLAADGEWYRDSDGVGNELPRAAWSKGAIRLDNSADGVVLLGCDDQVIDSLYWGREVTTGAVESAWSEPIRATPPWDGVSSAGPATFARRDPAVDTNSAADWYRSLCPTPGESISENAAPVVEDAVYALETGATLSQTLSASDADDDALTFTATAETGNLSVNAATGTFTFSAAAAGYYSIEVEVSDGCASASGTVRVCVAANTASCDLTCDSTKPEVCDGKDNDCNPATVDGSGDPAVGAPCDSPLDADGCLDEVRTCAAGELACPNVASGDAQRVETCDANNSDEDCDGGADDADPQGNASGKTAFFRDADGDGRGANATTQMRCDAGAGYVQAGNDCDDNPAACGNRCSPALTESQAIGNCNDHRDNDCDGATDTDASCGDDILCYLDRDHDGFGRFASEIVLTGAAADRGCVGYDDGINAPGSWVPDGSDCDDDPSACGAACHPGLTETCDTRDNDCDAATADGAGDARVGAACDAVGDGDVCKDDRATCQGGTVVCVNLTATDADQVEVCDAADVDEDCDGGADDDDPDGPPLSAPTWYRDRDGDGFGAADDALRSCAHPVGYAASDRDCDDDPAACGAACHPGADDVCDGADNDCDVLTNDGFDDVLVGVACDSDADADRCLDEVTTCVAGGAITCPNDAEGDTARVEVCDAGDVDEDCDGGADDDDPDGPPPGSVTYYADRDGDGHGATGSAQVHCDPPAATATRGDDCDDDPAACGAACFPGHGESPADGSCADGFDNDCDGATDIDPGCSGGAKCYADADRDGFGDALVATDVIPSELPAAGCSAWNDLVHPVGYWTAQAGDCDDADPDVSPADPEIVGDDVDDDCNGAVRCWADADDDGYAADGAAEADAPAGETCAEAVNLASEGGDCDDDPSACGVACNPGAIEICDARDNDCNAEIDEADGCAPELVGLIGGGEGCTTGAPSLLALFALGLAHVSRRRRTH